MNQNAKSVTNSDGKFKVSSNLIVSVGIISKALKSAFSQFVLSFKRKR